MPFMNTPTAHAAITADGTAQGYVTVADASPFFPGARVWLNNSTVGSKEYMVTDIAASNKIGLREVLEMNGGARYGRTPLTQWTVANSTTISQEANQAVYVELSNLAKVSRV